MKRNQIFFRAKVMYKDRPLWVNADLFDLDDESFRNAIGSILFRNGLLTGIKDEAIPGEFIENHVKKDLEEKYIKERLEEDN